MVNKKTEASKEWRFYRSQLETIVWDSNNDCALANFSEGHFTTKDPEVAKILRSLGYPEIPLDATEPPPDILVKKPTYTIEGDIPVVSSNITDPKMIEARIKARQKKIDGERKVSQPKPSPQASKLRRRKTSGKK